MNETEIEVQARALGFGRAFDLFREDVLEAARRAALHRSELNPPDDPACEPWPPMQLPAPR